MGRKCIDLSGPLKKYEFGQHIHAMNFPYLLVLHPEKGFWILKSKKDATNTLKKEDATVKMFSATMSMNHNIFPSGIRRPADKTYLRLEDLEVLGLKVQLRHMICI